MKRIGTYIIAWVILTMNLTSNLHGQGEEKIAIFTDRNLYVTGEEIHFSAMVEGKSAILYCELITPSGNKIASAKHQIRSGYSTGCLAIPEDVITGNYYLRSYTRYTRDLGPYHYSYVLLKIINPYKTEVLQSEKIIGDSLIEQTGHNDNDQDGLPGIIIDKEIYSPRDTAIITIQHGEILKSLFCLSVIPESSYFDITMSGAGIDEKQMPGLFFQPEIQGMTLTGRVLDKNTSLGVPVRIVNLSILGEKDIISVMTDSSGHFCFNLPDMKGSRDLFISTGENFSENLEIFVDNDFCALPVNIPVPVFQLSLEEQLAAHNLAVNHEISEYFNSPESNTPGGHDYSERSFYGEPSSILVMEKYIQLPTLKDYFYELPTPVNIRKKQGHDYFRFTASQAEMNIYDPLVLIDWVAIDDVGKILALPPQSISRIEFVNAPYVKGNQIFGGIINFISVKGDFAGIDLPSSGIFINFNFLSVDDHCEIRQTSGENEPDARNTVYWEPEIITDDGGSAEFIVVMPDTPGRYLVLLRGIGASGEKVEVKRFFEVRAKL